MSEMAQALYVGYELEETKEEKILSLYNEINSGKTTIYSPYLVQTVIVKVLDTLEFEVEGVNIHTTGMFE